MIFMYVPASHPWISFKPTGDILPGGIQRQGGASLVRATHGAPSSGAVPELRGGLENGWIKPNMDVMNITKDVPSGKLT